MSSEIIIEWSEEKNEILKKERGISFSVVSLIIEKEECLCNISHPNTKKYPHQRVYIIEIDKYVYAVPFVRDGKKVFLKTIIPSRKYTKLYLK